MIILPILTTSLILLSLKGWENERFELRSAGDIVCILFLLTEKHTAHKRPHSLNIIFTITNKAQLTNFWGALVIFVNRLHLVLSTVGE